MENWSDITEFYNQIECLNCCCYKNGIWCRANNNAICFKVKSTVGSATLFLCSIDYPHKPLIEISLSHRTEVHNIATYGERRYIGTPSLDLTRDFQDLWMTWDYDSIHIGFNGQPEPFFSYYNPEAEDKHMFGYIYFQTCQERHFADWIIDVPPIINELQSKSEFKKIDGGELRWVNLKDNKLPHDALIGGFEDGPLYIARAGHNGSLIPGKYMPSLQCAFVPWGRESHQKIQFEVLCGLNAAWVETYGNKIPQNALIAGVSEVRHEPLYIGRAVHDGHLIVGKVHVIYKTCYLPYQDKEVEVHKYEILVLPDRNPRGILTECKEAIIN